MLDITAESTITLTQATALLPPGRGGARPTLGCLLRWVLHGSRCPSGERVRLEAVRLGGRWVTSREALQRFAERLTPRMDDEPPAPPRTANQRRRESERAAQELERMGV
jgi:hypothetical protein